MVFSEALDPRKVDFAYINGTVDGKTIWDLIADSVFEAGHNLADATSLEKKRKRTNDEDEVDGGRRADNKARKAGAWGDLLSRAKEVSSSLTNHNEGAKEGEVFASVSAKGRPHICRSPADVLRSRIRQEIELYQSMSYNQGRIENPLEWWKMKELPRLSKLAKKFLCITAKSAPSERMFSSAGLTVTKKRDNLEGGKVATLCFINGSWKAGEGYLLATKKASIE
ncbi:hypothetical protein PsorP6_016877 [Peronosclerospora sorghi]|uniref:Uncharacterized protein n=1 Tax=Peronosclerospora sorghi TaxID=230839 RepID=A0ACC0WDX1_9STRA|nr:hypothetical protein PsorP6_016877 [Peronosclerospora sorghi]